MLNSANQRPGNLQRAEWRKECRQILSEHLSEADHTYTKGVNWPSDKSSRMQFGYHRPPSAGSPDSGYRGWVRVGDSS